MVPIAVLDEVDDARPLGDALRAAGIGCAEVTLRTAAGEEASRQMSGWPGLLVGAGTVLDAGQARRCAAVGAVTPYMTARPAAPASGVPSS